MQKKIRQYLRKGRTPYGLLTCEKSEIGGGTLIFGLSICNKKDNFTKNEARKLAEISSKNSCLTIPFRVDFDEIKDFIIRCKQYFRCNLILQTFEDPA